MSETDWTAQLCAAIQDGRLRMVLATADPTDGDRQLTSVRGAVESIDNAVEAVRSRLSAAMFDGDVTAEVGQRRSDRPLLLLDVRVDRTDATRGVEIVEELGFDRLGPAAPGPWRAFRTTHGVCTLVDRERSEFRVEVRWEVNRFFAGPLRRFVVPSAVDLAVTKLPERWWFGYVGIHLARLPGRWWRRSEPDHLGPFLVTPDSMIRPLLEFAGARPGELIVDLGCGDGRIAITAAQMGCRARGVESDAELARRAVDAAVAASVDGLVDIVHTDASKAPLDDADVVVMFLPVETVRRLLPDVLDRVRPGTRVVVHEQERVGGSPDRSAPIATADGITVAHLWVR